MIGQLSPLAFFHGGCATLGPPQQRALLHPFTNNTFMANRAWTAREFIIPRLIGGNFIRA